ncbi:hypothetical protein QN277_003939 [Acacia crassicarpa]|uniref:RNA-directed DNA polymerase (Reverse transcriptase) n=1 Tax=Acacia crassicarpa TaxID=499986 RepID=A0AAE1MHW8_9FABA|nr:hypothetical protein QN277_003939 [Acacia crassicarpa]
MAKLNGIQRSRAYPYSHFLNNLEEQLQMELDEVSRLEEIKWFQKARTEWIAKGDRNTRYYHIKTKIRRRNNRVLTLQDNNGNWVVGENDVKNLVVSYFKSLFQEDRIAEEMLMTWNLFPRIDQSRSADLGRIPSDVEIYDTIKSMGPFKAPGIDGFPPIFSKEIGNWWELMYAIL